MSQFTVWHIIHNRCCNTMQLQRCTSQVNWKEETNLCPIHFLVAAAFVTVDKSEERISLHSAQSCRQHRVPQLVLCIGAGGLNRAKDTNFAKNTTSVHYTLGCNNHTLGPMLLGMFAVYATGQIWISLQVQTLAIPFPNQKWTVQTAFDLPKIYPNIWSTFTLNLGHFYP